jgi:NAD kinase
MVLKPGLLGTYVSNTWVVLKCDVWRRMGKTSWTNHVKNEVVLHRDNAERNILHTIHRRTGNWIGDMFRDCH